MLTVYVVFWRDIPTTIKTATKNVRKGYIKPKNIERLVKDTKGTATIRKEFHMGNNNSIPEGQQKWTNELHVETENDWKYPYSLPTKCKLDARKSY